MSHHKLFYFNQPTIVPYLMLAMLIMFAGFDRLVTRIREVLYVKKGEKLDQIDEEAMNENLGNYFRCLNGLDQKTWYVREVYNREVLGKRMMDDKSLTLLSMFSREDKCISNICNYDILQNPKYADDFFYTSFKRRLHNF